MKNSLQLKKAEFFKMLSFNFNYNIAFYYNMIINDDLRHFHILFRQKKRNFQLYKYKYIENIYNLRGFDNF